MADLQRLVGVLMFATVVFTLARPYLRFLLDLLRSAGPRPTKATRLPFTEAARSDIGFWRKALTVLQINGRPVCANLRRARFTAELYTDASFRAGG